MSFSTFDVFGQFRSLDSLENVVEDVVGKLDKLSTAERDDDVPSTFDRWDYLKHNPNTNPTHDFYWEYTECQFLKMLKVSKETARFLVREIEPTIHHYKDWETGK